MSKRKFRFGVDYFGSWTVGKIEDAGYSVTVHFQSGQLYGVKWANK